MRLIYCENSNIKYRFYSTLTDNHTCSIFFNFICTKEYDIWESKSRNLISETLKQPKIIKKFDLSNAFWERFQIRDVKLKKVMGLYEIENIDNPNISTIAVNPNKYFEKLKNRSINKKRRE